MPSQVSLLVQQRLSPARLATYLRAVDPDGGGLDAAVDLYLWNADVAGAFWVDLGHVEVVLRNTMHDALTVRHHAKRRHGVWLDDPAAELEQRARGDIAKAKARLHRAHAPLLPGKIVAELPFGFWRYLLARRYTATLWPALRPAFAHLPSSDRRRLEVPVARLHRLRNRIAHHEPLIAEPLAERHQDLVDVLQAVDPQLAPWVAAHSRVRGALDRRPRP